MLSPPMYSPPQSQHHSMWIFHCWKQCCRASSDSLFMSSVAFAFTASTDLNLALFNADLIFGNLVLHQKHLDRQGVVCLVHCLVEEPISYSSTFQVFFLSPVHKVCQNLLVVDLVNGLNFRHPIHVNNPSDVEKNNHHCFIFGFAMPCFLLPWWTGVLPVHGLVLTFWVILERRRRKKKPTIHHKLLCSLKSLGHFQCFEECQHKCSFESPFCLGVRSLDTIFEHTFFVLKLLCKICRTVSSSMLINSTTAWMLRQRFCWTISPTFSMLASVFYVLGQMGHWSSPISSLPSLNLLNQLKTWVPDRHSSP